MVLPCILFWISFGPKLRLPWKRRQHTRETLLAHRELVRAAGDPAPEAVANIVMVTAQTAPLLFQDATRRPDGERLEGGERGDRRQRGERGDRRERGERGERPG